MRNALLTGLFCFGLLSGLQAQDKYEFASVAQNSIAKLEISVEGKPFETQPLGKEVKSNSDHGKLFAYVGEMQNEGWEVFNVTYSDAVSMTFVLRRKK